MGDRATLELRVEFDDKGKPASESSLAEFEALIGHQLPKGYAEFIRQHSGANFDLHKIVNPALDEFLAVAEIFPVGDNIEITARILGNLADRVCVFASAGARNFFLFDLNDAFAVHFWSRAKPAETIYLAPDFTSFMNSMEPISADELPYPEGAVVEINPMHQVVFNELLRKYGIDREDGTASSSIPASTTETFPATAAAPNPSRWAGRRRSSGRTGSPFRRA
jgi:hypothetical protein